MTVPFGEEQTLSWHEQVGVGTDDGAVGGVDGVPAGGDLAAGSVEGQVARRDRPQAVAGPDHDGPLGGCDARDRCDGAVRQRETDQGGEPAVVTGTRIAARGQRRLGQARGEGHAAGSKHETA